MRSSFVGSCHVAIFIICRLFILCPYCFFEHIPMHACVHVWSESCQHFKKSPNGRVGLGCTNIFITRPFIIKQSHLFSDNASIHFSNYIKLVVDWTTLFLYPWVPKKPYIVVDRWFWARIFSWDGNFTSLYFSLDSHQKILLNGICLMIKWPYA